MEQLPSPRETVGATGVVFFDIFGVYMVCYGRDIAVGVNLATLVLFVVASVRGSSDRTKLVRQHWDGFRTLLAGAGLGVAASVTAGVLLEVAGSSMVWYGHPWLLIGIYVVPCLSIFYQHLWRCGRRASELPREADERLARGVATFWALFLAVCTVFDLSAAFVGCWALLFPILVRTAVAATLRMAHYVYSFLSVMRPRCSNPRNVLLCALFSLCSPWPAQARAVTPTTGPSFQLQPGALAFGLSCFRTGSTHCDICDRYRRDNNGLRGSP